MTKQEFYKIMQKIEMTYNKRFTKEELQLWFDEFKDISIIKFANSINEHIKKDKFPPRIADIWDKLGMKSMTYFTNDPYGYLYKNLEWCEIVNVGGTKQ